MTKVATRVEQFSATIIIRDWLVYGSKSREAREKDLLNSQDKIRDKHKFEANFIHFWILNKKN